MRQRVSSYARLVEEFGSKLIEMEVTLEEMIYTRRVILHYLDSSVMQHLDPPEEDWLLHVAIENYGVGNYEEAIKDNEEYSTIFN